VRKNTERYIEFVVLFWTIYSRCSAVCSVYTF